MSKKLKGIIIGVFMVLLCSIVGVIAVKAANKDKSETLGSISYEIGAFDVVVLAPLVQLVVHRGEEV